MSRALTLPQDRRGRIIPHDLVTDACLGHFGPDLRDEEDYPDKSLNFGFGPSTSSGYGIDATKIVYVIDAIQNYGVNTANTPLSIVVLDLLAGTDDAVASATQFPGLVEARDCDSDVMDISASGMIYELRRKTGLSWGQLGRLLGVSRRTIHNWANGLRISLKNQERLSKLTATIRYLDRGSAETNITFLLGPASNGETFFELLQNCAFETAQELAGRGPTEPSLDWDTGVLSKIPIRGKSPGQSGLFSKEAEEYLRDEDGTGEGQASDAKVLSKPSLRRTKFRPK